MIPDYVRQTQNELKEYKISGALADDDKNFLLEKLAHLPPDRVDSILSNMAFNSVVEDVSDNFSLALSPEEVATKASVDVERTKAYLELFALDFGLVRSDFDYPSPAHELTLRPLIKHDGIYLCPDPQLLLWAIRPRLEQVLNPDIKDAVNTSKIFWKVYEDTRAKYVEQEGLRLLSKILGRVEVHHGLNYKVMQAGQLISTELDGLILFDDCLFLVEAKGGGFSAPGRRGAQDRMLKHLKELLASPHEQALRAKQYIEETEKPEFTFDKNPKLLLDKSEVRRIFLISITLDSLDAFSVAIQTTMKTGIFKEGAFPWAVSLLSLRVIAEMIEIPVQFIHYLLQRLRISEVDRVHTMDEIDFLGCYLNRGLWFEDSESQKMNLIMLDTWTEEIDKYYTLQAVGTSVPKPRQFMPDRFRTILEELEDVHALGYSEAGLLLIDIGGDSREKFIELFDRIREQTKLDGKQHDFSMHFGKFGITCWSATEQQTQNALERLFPWVELKKYKAKAEKWLGILTTVDNPSLISAWVIRSFPWERSDEMESCISI